MDYFEMWHERIDYFRQRRQRTSGTSDTELSGMECALSGNEWGSYGRTGKRLLKKIFESISGKFLQSHISIIGKRA